MTKTYLLIDLQNRQPAPEASRHGWGRTANIHTSTIAGGERRVGNVFFNRFNYLNHFDQALIKYGDGSQQRGRHCG